MQAPIVFFLYTFQKDRHQLHWGSDQVCTYLFSYLNYLFILLSNITLLMKRETPVHRKHTWAHNQFLKYNGQSYQGEK